jgi:hypothetical protein
MSYLKQHMAGGDMYRICPKFTGQDVDHEEKNELGSILILPIRTCWEGVRPPVV